MGANAQTSVPTFTAGEVLTAANMNISARTGVPVFADTTARDAGFGGTGEKTLAEGQLCYLESTDVVQYYDGSNWATVGPSTAPGLVLISSTTIGTAVSSVTVTNAFSSTYRNYLIQANVNSSSTNNSLNLTLGSTTTGYYRFVFVGNYPANTVTGSNTSNGASIPTVVISSTNGGFAGVNVYNPNETRRTGFVINSLDFQTVGGVYPQGAFLDDATAYTAFTLTASTGTVTGGEIRVYGYRN